MRIPICAICVATAAFVSMSTGANAGEVTIPGVFGGVFDVPVTSIRERRLMTIVRQEYDFSCGAAAVATLLTYHYLNPTDEAHVFEAMFEVGDQEKIRDVGFSMLDMKSYLEARGFHVDGFRLPLDKVEDIGVPVITLIDINGYRHFVVVKGMQDGRVLVGDPAYGTNVMDRERFQEIWSGTVLAIRDEPYEAMEYFNVADEWRVRPNAPVADAVDNQGLASFTINLPGSMVNN